MGFFYESIRRGWFWINQVIDSFKQTWKIVFFRVELVKRAKWDAGASINFILHSCLEGLPSWLNQQ